MATRSPVWTPSSLSALAALLTSRCRSREGDGPGVAGLADPVVGDLVAEPALDVAVDAVVGDVELAADEPLGERQVPLEGRVERPRPSRCARAPAAPRTPRSPPRPRRTARPSRWPGPRTPGSGGKFRPRRGGSRSRATRRGRLDAHGGILIGMRRLAGSSYRGTGGSVGVGGEVVLARSGSVQVARREARRRPGPPGRARGPRAAVGGSRCRWPRRPRAGACGTRRWRPTAQAPGPSPGS